MVTDKTVGGVLLPHCQGMVTLGPHSHVSDLDAHKCVIYEAVWVRLGVVTVFTENHHEFISFGLALSPVPQVPLHKL